MIYAGICNTIKLRLSDFLILHAQTRRDHSCVAKFEDVVITSKLELHIPDPFDKVPLVFESTGAWGEHTVSWFNNMVRMHKNLGLPTLRMMGLTHTFTANTFSSFWAQRLSMVQAVHHAETVVLVSGESLPSEVQG